MNIEEVQMLGFEIVALAGDARSTLLEALTLLAEKKVEEADELRKKANDLLSKAHSRQVSLLQQEVSGSPVPYNFIFMHGQDHLMNAMLLNDLYEVFKKNV